MPVALKEWAIAVRALAEGEQLVTLRKGGIREDNRHFELLHDRFFLYPTFDHQQGGLVRESHVPELRRALEDGVWEPPAPTTKMLEQGASIPQPVSVRVRAWAQVTGSWEIDSTVAVNSLAPYHVWREEYAVKRLNWKPRHPLHVMLLRVHRIPRPVTIRVKDAYAGCRSWIEITRELPFEGTPVLSDDEFARVEREIEGLIGSPTTLA